MAQNQMENKKILETEKAILKKEEELLKEEKKLLETEEKILQKEKRNQWMLTTLITLVILALAGGLMYFKANAGRVYIDKSVISAPVITLGPTAPGQLNDIYANVGDVVAAHSVVARVGTELIKSNVAGLIVDTSDNLGQQVAPGQAIVKMIDPNELRVDGEIDEDKGLADIRIGDRVIFTVDAFGGKQYQGIVDEISPIARQNDVVFNISDKRQVNQFDVKARFDAGSYPELKNGMSARMWVYTR